MNTATGAIVGVITAVIGVSIIATLVSNQAQTSNVITASGNALSAILKAATAPVTNASGLPNLSGALNLSSY